MSKVYLKVPFPEKDEVKSKGGKFESENKLWYCYSENLGLFSSKWPVYINCPFTDKEDAKSKGAMFDGDKKNVVCKSRSKSEFIYQVVAAE